MDIGVYWCTLTVSIWCLVSMDEIFLVDFQSHTGIPWVTLSKVNLTNNVPHCIKMGSLWKSHCYFWFVRGVVWCISTLEPWIIWVMFYLGGTSWDAVGINHPVINVGPWDHHLVYEEILDVFTYTIYGGVILWTLIVSDKYPGVHTESFLTYGISDPILAHQGWQLFFVAQVQVVIKS